MCVCASGISRDSSSLVTHSGGIIIGVPVALLLTNLAYEEAHHHSDDRLLDSVERFVTVRRRRHVRPPDGIAHRAVRILVARAVRQVSTSASRKTRIPEASRIDSNSPRRAAARTVPSEQLLIRATLLVVRSPLFA